MTKQTSPNSFILPAFVLASGVALGQAKPQIAQKAEKSTCANIVALAGSVDLKCSSLTIEQERQLIQIRAMISQVLKKQVDADTLERMLKAAAPQVTTGQSSIVQATAGSGLNILQGTTGANSPILNSPISVGDVQMSISDDAKRSLVAYLKSKVTGRIYIMADQNASLAPLAQQFYEIFSEGGWEMASPNLTPIDAMYAQIPPPRSVVIRYHVPAVKDRERLFFSNFDPTPLVADVAQALGLTPVLIPSPDTTAGTINVTLTGRFTTR